MDALFESIREMTEQAEVVKMQLERLEGLYPVMLVGAQKPATRGHYISRFEANNKKGVDAHNVEWLLANERAIAVAQHYHLDIERPEIKALLTDLVFQILKKQ